MDSERKCTLKIVITLACGVLFIELLMMTYFFGLFALPWVCHVSYFFGLGYACNGLFYMGYIGGIPLYDPCWLVGVALTLFLNALPFALTGKWMRRGALFTLVIAYATGVYFTFVDMIGSIT